MLLHSTTAFLQSPLSRLAGIIANCQSAVVKKACIDLFLRLYPVDMSEAINSDPYSYASFNAFFTRHLKPQKRPIAQDSDAVVSPVDGIVYQVGTIEQGQLFQAKGFHFQLAELLGGDPTLAKEFDQGEFFISYLAPHNYHRVHLPYAGRLQSMIYIPGDLFSVGPRTTQTVPNLFARNERVVCIFDTSFGPMAVILIGAMLVGSIHTVWAGQVAPPKRSQIVRTEYSCTSPTLIDLEKGAELGHFQMGSSVILLFPANTLHWSQSLTAGKELRFGEIIASLY